LLFGFDLGGFELFAKSLKCAYSVRYGVEELEIFGHGYTSFRGEHSTRAKRNLSKQGVFPMVEIICAAIAAVSAVCVAVVERRNFKQNKKIEERAEQRAKESRLSMDLMYANCALSLTTAKKLANMHTNGDVEEAMDAAQKAQDAYNDFLRDMVSHNVTK
jgi:uncharacterized protein YsxB (DUF464 family)